MTKPKYQDRVQLAVNPAAKKFFQLMTTKETNLILSNDESNKEKFLELAETLGPEICALKTHIDIIENFDESVIQKLVELSRRHYFMIFEDRKFADIGHTVQLQYSRGVYHIADWADLVNAHTLPGPGLIEGLKEIALEKNLPRGLILLAQMSSKENLFTPDYTKKTIEMAEKYADFVAGFIGNGGNPEELQKLASQVDPKFVIMTPGVNLAQSGDGLKQSYNTPEKAIAAGSDAIIVGRGIYGADNPVKAAQEYRMAGWRAYLAR